jgi:hypothetical protein
MAPKGFQKGHGGFAPKLRAMRTRQLASAVRDNISVEVIVWFHKAILMGHDAKLTDDEDEAQGPYWDADCGVGVTWKAGGLAPTLDQRIASMKQLTDRGHGQAAQLIAVEQSIRVEGGASGALDLGALPPALVLQVRELLRGQLASGEDSPAGSTDASDDSSDDSSGVIDAESTEVDDDSSDDDPPAGSTV